MSEENEALDLDWEFVDHLVIPESMHRIQIEHIPADLIVDQEARRIYEYQLSYMAEHHGKPATKLVLEDEFSSTDLVFAEPETLINDLLDRIRNRYIRKVGNRRLKDLAKVAVHDPQNFAKQLNETSRELSRVVAKKGAALALSDVDLALREYHKRKARGMGPSLGFKEVDEHYYGQYAMTFFVGAPGGYKSWAMGNAALENVIQGRTVVFYPLELPAFDMDMRIRCMAADVPHWKYVKNMLSEDDEKLIRDVSHELNEIGTLHVMKPPRNERGADQLVPRAMDLGADVVFIDQLQQMNTSDGNTIGGENSTGMYWDVISHLADYSDEVPICVAHQFNRSVRGMDEFPEMQQIKGSAAVEEFSTLALGLWANKEMRKSNIVQIGALKSRQFAFANWDIKINLTSGCKFDLIERVDI